MVDWCSHLAGVFQFRKKSEDDVSPVTWQEEATAKNVSEATALACFAIWQTHPLTSSPSQATAPSESMTHLLLASL
jgi:hypothetical protein